MIDMLKDKTLSLDVLLGDVDVRSGGEITKQTYAILRSLVIKMQLLPNQVLSEKEVADCLGISKTPVREAFIKLAEERLLRIVPKSGTYVAPINLDRAFEGYFVRRSLEVSAVELAAQRRTYEDICFLKAKLAQQREASREERYKDFYRLDNEFHEAFFRIADVPNVWHIVETSKAEVDRIRNLKMKAQIRRLDGVIEDHTAVTEAVVKRDVDAAGKAMAAHVDMIRISIEKLIEAEEFWDLLEWVNNSVSSRRRNVR